MSTGSIRKALNALFAYKAEWLKEDIFELFSTPKYFPELSTHYPCVLMGGRGTGKTTVLRGLSYQGRWALAKESEPVDAWESYSFYHRVDTNRVAAFHGPEVTPERWKKIFGHYMNLLLCDLVLEFLEWYEGKIEGTVSIDPVACSRIATSLCIQTAETHASLRDSVVDGLIRFEAYINNIADSPALALSMQGAPVARLFASLAETTAFKGKTFAFLIDEYENLSYPQQQVVNTLIKHASDTFVFKIGVKELGWRCRTTLHPDEQLVSPADYRLVKISVELEAVFPEFAAAVCNARLAKLAASHEQDIPDITRLLEDWSVEEEAKALGVGKWADTVRSELSDDMASSVGEFTDFELYFAKYWAIGHDEDVESLLLDWLHDAKKWQGRLINHGHASMFQLKRGKTGIRKYFGGWSCFTQLSATNIRYLLELVDQSLVSHLGDEKSLQEPVTYKTQTIAAQRVGQKNLGELEGLSVHGAKLAKLLLGMGRVFGVMAADAAGHAPEVNQFELGDEPLDEVAELLRAAVMHLALVRFSGTKPGDDQDVKDYDYAIHPIFAPFFAFSHRRKRKLGSSEKFVARWLS